MMESEGIQRRPKSKMNNECGRSGVQREMKYNQIKQNWDQGMIVN